MQPGKTHPRLSSETSHRSHCSVETEPGSCCDKYFLQQDTTNTHDDLGSNNIQILGQLIPEAEESPVLTCVHVRPSCEPHGRTPWKGHYFGEKFMGDELESRQLKPALPTHLLVVDFVTGLLLFRLFKVSLSSHSILGFLNIFHCLNPSCIVFNILP
jgi:hypothetical protein